MQARRASGPRALSGSFQHRSGRVVSLARLVLASAFLVAVYLDPGQAARYPEAGYAILTAYLVAATLYFVATRTDWWLESRLAPWAHVVDIAVFGAMLFLTEGYTSPFFTFFTFIILSATIKWGWRETAATAAAVTLLFLAAGLAAIQLGSGELELRRLLIRCAYLVVLSLLLIWFSFNQKSFRAGRAPLPELIDPEQPAKPPIERAARYAAHRLGSSHIVLTWWETEEPWYYVATLSGDSFAQDRHGPAGFNSPVDPELQGAAFLFDAGKGRALRLNGSAKRRTSVRGRLIEPELTPFLPSGCGVAIPIQSDQIQGVLFAFDLPGLCADDLPIAGEIGAEISAAMDHACSLALFQESGEAKTRLALSRDLHDNMAQLLAGASFRLEGVRKSIAAGREVESEILSLQQTFSSEQRDLRAVIAELRQDGRNEDGQDLRDTLRALCDRLARQWAIKCELSRCPVGIFPPQRKFDAVRHLVREAVANAVRHGKASVVTISADAGQSGLSLIVADNGGGLAAPPSGDSPAKPWSLHERVQELGGSLSIYSSERGLRLIISLPHEEHAWPGY